MMSRLSPSLTRTLSQARYGSTRTPSVQVTQMLINNQWVEGSKKFDTFNPSTGEKIASISSATTNDVNKAVEAAREAFHYKSAWRTLDASERGRTLFKLADLIEANADYLTSLETLDNGKPLADSSLDIMLSIKCLRYYAGYADKIHGRTIPMDGPFTGYTRVEPVGVCGQIIPWNFPILMLAWKFGPALCTGNTVILKPAEQTSLTALFIGKLVIEAGFPPGVVNILPGLGHEAGVAIANHLDIDKVAFTGSTSVGKLIQEAAGKSNAKRLTLELGGKSPLVICEDADLDLAAQLAHFAVFLNQGQCCCAATRTFVHESVYDKFVEKSAALAKGRKVGDPFDKDVIQGPQIDQTQMDKILGLIQTGKKEGAKIVTGGDRIGSKGYFVQPTVFANVEDDMTIAKEEIFGPVQQILRYKTLDEVIERSNKSEYGLAAGIVTNDINKSLTYSHAVQSGTVYVNTFMAFSAQTPFGGYKQSGQGRELGEDGLHGYCEVKQVTINNPNKHS